MRRMLAGFLATSMIVAVASSVTFAATNSAASITGAAIGNTTLPGGGYINARVTGPSDFTTTGAGIDGGDPHWYANLTVRDATIAFSDGSKINVSIGSSTRVKDTHASNAFDLTTAPIALNVSQISTISSGDIGNAVNGKSYAFDGVIKGSEYTGKLSFASDTGAITFDQKAALPSDINLTGISLNVTVDSIETNATVTYQVGGDTKTGVPVTVDMDSASVKSFTVATSGALLNRGSGTGTADVDKAGDLESYDIRDVLVCYGDGTPIPMTEKDIGVDRDLNNEGGVQSGSTVYFMIRDDDAAAFDRLEDDNYWKIKISKGDNGKYVKNISDVTKIIGSKGMYNADNGKAIKDIDFTKRHRFVKLELNEIYTDDEHKLTFDLRLSAQSRAVDAGIVNDDDTEIKIKDFYFYMKNMVKDADNDWKVGIGGLMLNPLENDWNEVTYFDEDGDLAFMKFFADSDVDKFYAKLSTKWEHADYASYFNDQDAFIFNFTGSPKLSSTSRADLQIYNPFVDEDGNETVDPTTAVVYQVIDGDLYDVTDSFEYKEGENGDMAFCTRTRFLGTYIICEKAVEEAVADETVPDELTPDTTEAPEDLTPDNNAGGKQPANTGRYI